MVNWRMSGALMDVEHCHEFSGTTLTFDANTGACGLDFVTPSPFHERYFL